MSRGRSAQVLVHRWHAGGSLRRSPDEVIVEEPLEIRLDDHLVTTTMRTPGHDFELAVGFCVSEGLLDDAPVRNVRYCATGAASDTQWNTVTVETGGRAPAPKPRLTLTTSACGICGSDSVDALRERIRPLDPTEPISLDVLASIPERARTEQSLFAATGGVHAAAVFAADGTILHTREDVGRHNAVDKVVGRLLLDGALPARRCGLFVSGRASFELVQKAWAAGFSALVAVGAPSSLAVETARVAQLTLAGFVRSDRLNVYSPERLTVPSTSGSPSGR